ncbi:putative replication initiator protein [Mycobacterium kansasii 662]|nr:replication initiator [Mycobacterium kansasii]AGZ49613.1 plasmid replication initiator protein [Mycobacterium kansasii ATCC 12478]EUA18901.1 putative replication initiator protein [Mycobacterium kansasii 662]OOK72325.1 putative replication initiator protein [Mycobacterium kansasii]
MSMLASTSLTDWLAPGSPAIDQAIRRASSPGHESWWQRCAAVGFCANPVQASACDPDLGRRMAVMIRCGNRRAAICPSCSDLYAADTWQLVHAGTQGGHHGMPETTANRPQVFATLTAPSFGAVHTSSSRPGLADTVCHSAFSGKSHCPHGKALWCNAIHASDDPEVGQPLCPDCYDYTGHVLFNWHAPELWRRFTIALRRAVADHLRRIGIDPNAVRVSFVKVAEYQRRAVVHYHTIIRLDPPNNDDSSTGASDAKVSAIELAALVRQAANQVRLPVTVDAAAGAAATASESEARMLRFGSQIDTQPLNDIDDTGKPGLARRVAAYLAKYTTKSVAEFGIAARRISPAAIAELDIPAHTRRILSTLVNLATLPANTAMAGWLHTLGYRGHITSKSRRYSITTTALRAARRHWRIHRADQPEHVDVQHNSHDQEDWSNSACELSDWRIDGVGHRNDGERLLVHTAALRAREYRYLARLDASQNSGASP